MLDDGSVNPGFVGDITCQHGQKVSNVPTDISTIELTDKTKVHNKKQSRWKGIAPISVIGLAMLIALVYFVVAYVQKRAGKNTFY